MGKKDRILLKLSGASLRGKSHKYVVEHSVISDLSEQIKELSKEYEVAIVVGGGNIWRGYEHVPEPLNNQDTHIIGMLATVINSIALQNYLSYKGVSSTIFSAIPIPKIAGEICTQNLKRSFERGDVVIFSGGTGVPFVTTDTCTAVRALEIGANKILIGKNGVDGVYDKDPNKYPDAKFYDKVSYEYILDSRIVIMDLTAMSILKENNRPQLVIFNNDEKDAFIRSLKGEIRHTIVY